MRTTMLVTGLLLAMLPAAGAEIIDIRRSADGAFTHEGKIAAGKFVEV